MKTKQDNGTRRARTARTVVRRIPLADLVERPGAGVAQSARLRRALRAHIARHGCYPALVVRPHPQLAGRYELLDGRHRAAVLRELGRRTARCEVWPLDGEEAELAAATLNSLRGRPDARSATAAARRLVARCGEAATGLLLGLTPRALRQRLAGPGRQVSRAPVLPLHPVVFHLNPAQHERLQRALRAAGAGGLSRAEALLKAVEGSAAGAADAGRA